MYKYLPTHTNKRIGFPYSPIPEKLYDSSRRAVWVWYSSNRDVITMQSREIDQYHINNVWADFQRVHDAVLRHNSEALKIENWGIGSNVDSRRIICQNVRC